MILWQVRFAVWGLLLLGIYDIFGSQDHLIHRSCITTAVAFRSVRERVSIYLFRSTNGKREEVIHGDTMGCGRGQFWHVYNPHCHWKTRSPEPDRCIASENYWAFANAPEAPKSGSVVCNILLLHGRLRFLNLQL